MEPAHRIDAFTDAAFAFAVSLLVVGAGGGAGGDVLRQTVAAIPAFAIGFAIIAMFWLAHVAWRRLRGPGDGRATVLTLLLVFVTLIYVVPLRAMATAFADFLRGNPTDTATAIGELFVIYGIGFCAMSVVTAFLFRDVLRARDLPAATRQAALGQVWIWSILAWTGALSTILALFAATQLIAPWLYATLPLTVGLFAWQWDWSVADGRGTARNPAGEPVLAPDDVEAAPDDQRRA
ncbi:Uncharacterized membrane protein [Sphingomonas guangdongensis]|uniref:Uncharacterized membrane protein n=1 Tax=Sphingomonas guangdongensis TaxID=1141890 RepID=A0A285QLG8_9SPHN|nr:TMEM175 family protein [Sphingomonas guangdongensis]SOB80932.1 Uncharacterized membrane protein [Sphingomonas guangdongensis]